MYPSPPGRPTSRPGGFHMSNHNSRKFKELSYNTCHCSTPKPPLCKGGWHGEAVTGGLYVLSSCSHLLPQFDNPSVSCADSSLYTREPWGAPAPVRLLTVPNKTDSDLIRLSEPPSPPRGRLATPVLRHWFAMRCVSYWLSGNSANGLIRLSEPPSSQGKAMERIRQNLKKLCPFCGFLWQMETGCVILTLNYISK